MSAEIEFFIACRCSDAEIAAYLSCEPWQVAALRGAGSTQ